MPVESAAQARSRTLKITVIGLGHVGIMAAAGFASVGHDVLGVDIEPSRILSLQRGELFLYEPGLQPMVQAGVRKGNLRFAHLDDAAAVLGDVAIIAAGTPPVSGGNADLRQIRSALDWIKSKQPRGLVLVMKSTVPPGTGRRIIKDDLRGADVSYVAVPEFIREGSAVADWSFPERVVVGADPNDLRSLDLVKQAHAGIAAPFIVTDVTSAEMIKYASNAFLATRISFINEIAALCDSLGASVDDVGEALAMDSRTGDRIFAGVGYGGSCFPKDVRALNHIALTSGVGVELLRSVINVNNRQRLLPLYALRRRFNGAVSRLRVAVLGLAFKPNTDDVREAPSLDLIDALVNEGAEVWAYDPQASGAARERLPESVRLAADPVEAAKQAQAAVLLTEWDEIVTADWESIAEGMRPPKFVFDGRNALNKSRMLGLGFEYLGVGRGGGAEWSIERESGASLNVEKYKEED